MPSRISSNPFPQDPFRSDKHRRNAEDLQYDAMTRLFGSSEMNASQQNELEKISRTHGEEAAKSYIRSLQINKRPLTDDSALGKAILSSKNSAMMPNDFSVQFGGVSENGTEVTLSHSSGFSSTFNMKANFSPKFGPTYTISRDESKFGYSPTIGFGLIREYNRDTQQFSSYVKTPELTLSEAITSSMDQYGNRKGEQKNRKTPTDFLFRTINNLAVHDEEYDKAAENVAFQISPVGQARISNKIGFFNSVVDSSGKQVEPSIKELNGINDYFKQNYNIAAPLNTRDPMAFKVTDQQVYVPGKNGGFEIARDAQGMPISSERPASMLDISGMLQQNVGYIGAPDATIQRFVHKVGANGEVLPELDAENSGYLSSVTAAKQRKNFGTSLGPTVQAVPSRFEDTQVLNSDTGQYESVTRRVPVTPRQITGQNEDRGKIAFYNLDQGTDGRMFGRVQNLLMTPASQISGSWSPANMAGNPNGYDNYSQFSKETVDLPPMSFAQMMGGDVIFAGFNAAKNIGQVDAMPQSKMDLGTVNVTGQTPVDISHMARKSRDYIDDYEMLLPKWVSKDNMTWASGLTAPSGFREVTKDQRSQLEQQHGVKMRISDTAPYPQMQIYSSSDVASKFKSGVKASVNANLAVNSTVNAGGVNAEYDFWGGEVKDRMAFMMNNYWGALSTDQQRNMLSERLAINEVQTKGYKGPKSNTKVARKNYSEEKEFAHIQAKYNNIVTRDAIPEKGNSNWNTIAEFMNKRLGTNDNAPESAARLFQSMLFQEQDISQGGGSRAITPTSKRNAYNWQNYNFALSDTPIDIVGVSSSERQLKYEYFQALAKSKEPNLPDKVIQDQFQAIWNWKKVGSSGMWNAQYDPTKAGAGYNMIMRSVISEQIEHMGAGNDITEDVARQLQIESPELAGALGIGLTGKPSDKNRALGQLERWQNLIGGMRGLYGTGFDARALDEDKITVQGNMLTDLQDALVDYKPGEGGSFDSLMKKINGVLEGQEDKFLEFPQVGGILPGSNIMRVANYQQEGRMISRVGSDWLTSLKNMVSQESSPNGTEIANNFALNSDVMKLHGGLSDLLGDDAAKNAMRQQVDMAGSLKFGASSLLQSNEAWMNPETREQFLRMNNMDYKGIKEWEAQFSALGKQAVKAMKAGKQTGDFGIPMAGLRFPMELSQNTISRLGLIPDEVMAHRASQSISQWNKDNPNNQKNFNAIGELINNSRFNNQMFVAEEFGSKHQGDFDLDPGLFILAQKISQGEDSKVTYKTKAGEEKTFDFGKNAIGVSQDVIDTFYKSNPAKALQYEQLLYGVDLDNGQITNALMEKHSAQLKNTIDLMEAQDPFGKLNDIAANQSPSTLFGMNYFSARKLMEQSSIHTEAKSSGMPSSYNMRRFFQFAVGTVGFSQRESSELVEGMQAHYQIPLDVSNMGNQTGGTNLSRMISQANIKRDKDSKTYLSLSSNAYDGGSNMEYESMRFDSGSAGMVRGFQWMIKQASLGVREEGKLNNKSQQITSNKTLATLASTGPDSAKYILNSLEENRKLPEADQRERSKVAYDAALNYATKDIDPGDLAGRDAARYNAMGNSVLTTMVLGSAERKRTFDANGVPTEVDNNPDHAEFRSNLYDQGHGDIASRMETTGNMFRIESGKGGNPTALSLNASARFLDSVIADSITRNGSEQVPVVIQSMRKHMNDLGGSLIQNFSGNTTQVHQKTNREIALENIRGLGKISLLDTETTGIQGGDKGKLYNVGLWGNGKVENFFIKPNMTKDEYDANWSELNKTNSDKQWFKSMPVPDDEYKNNKQVYAGRTTYSEMMNKAQDFQDVFEQHISPAIINSGRQYGAYNAGFDRDVLAKQFEEDLVNSSGDPARQDRVRKNYQEFQSFQDKDFYKQVGLPAIFDEQIKKYNEAHKGESGFIPAVGKLEYITRSVLDPANSEFLDKYYSSQAQDEIRTAHAHQGDVDVNVLNWHRNAGEVLSVEYFNNQQSQAQAVSRNMGQGMHRGVVPSSLPGQSPQASTQPSPSWHITMLSNAEDENNWKMNSTMDNDVIRASMLNTNPREKRGMNSLVLSLAAMKAEEQNIHNWEDLKNSIESIGGTEVHNRAEKLLENNPKFISEQRHAFTMNDLIYSGKTDLIERDNPLSSYDLKAANNFAKPGEPDQIQPVDAAKYAMQQKVYKIASANGDPDLIEKATSSIVPYDRGLRNAGDFDKAAEGAAARAATGADLTPVPDVSLAELNKRAHDLKAAIKSPIVQAQVDAVLASFQAGTLFPQNSSGAPYKFSEQINAAANVISQNVTGGTQGLIAGINWPGQTPFTIGTPQFATNAQTQVPPQMQTPAGGQYASKNMNPGFTFPTSLNTKIKAARTMQDYANNLSTGQPLLNQVASVMAKGTNVGFGAALGSVVGSLDFTDPTSRDQFNAVYAAFGDEAKIATFNTDQMSFGIGNISPDDGAIIGGNIMHGSTSDSKEYLATKQMLDNAKKKMGKNPLDFIRTQNRDSRAREVIDSQDFMNLKGDFHNSLDLKSKTYNFDFKKASGGRWGNKAMHNVAEHISDITSYLSDNPSEMNNPFFGALMSSMEDPDVQDNLSRMFKEGSSGWNKDLLKEWSSIARKKKNVNPLDPSYSILQHEEAGVFVRHDINSSRRALSNYKRETAASGGTLDPERVMALQGNIDQALMGQQSWDKSHAQMFSDFKTGKQYQDMFNNAIGNSEFDEARQALERIKSSNPNMTNDQIMQKLTSEHPEYRNAVSNAVQAFGGMPGNFKQQYENTPVHQMMIGIAGAQDRGVNVFDDRKFANSKQQTNLSEAVDNYLDTIKKFSSTVTDLRSEEGKKMLAFVDAAKQVINIRHAENAKILSAEKESELRDKISSAKTPEERNRLFQELTLQEEHTGALSGSVEIMKRSRSMRYVTQVKGGSAVDEAEADANYASDQDKPGNGPNALNGSWGSFFRHTLGGFGMMFLQSVGQKVISPLVSGYSERQQEQQVVSSTIAGISGGPLDVSQQDYMNRVSGTMMTGTGFQAVQQAKIDMMRWSPGTVTAGETLGAGVELLGASMWLGGSVPREYQRFLAMGHPEGASSEAWGKFVTDKPGESAELVQGNLLKMGAGVALAGQLASNGFNIYGALQNTDASSRTIANGYLNGGDRGGLDLTAGLIQSLQGGVTGGLFGSMAGPWGAAVGAGLGATAGALSSQKNWLAYNFNPEIKRQTDLAESGLVLFGSGMGFNQSGKLAGYSLAENNKWISQASYSMGQNPSYSDISQQSIAASVAYADKFGSGLSQDQIANNARYMDLGINLPELTRGMITSSHVGGLNFMQVAGTKTIDNYSSISPNDFNGLANTFGDNTQASINTGIQVANNNADFQKYLKDNGITLDDSKTTNINGQGQNINKIFYGTDKDGRNAVFTQNGSGNYADYGNVADQQEFQNYIKNNYANGKITTSQTLQDMMTSAFDDIVKNLQTKGFDQGQARTITSESATSLAGMGYFTPSDMTMLQNNPSGFANKFAQTAQDYAELQGTYGQQAFDARVGFQSLAISTGGAPQGSMPAPGAFKNMTPGQAYVSTEASNYAAGMLAKITSPDFVGQRMTQMEDWKFQQQNWGFQQQNMQAGNVHQEWQFGMQQQQMNLGNAYTHNQWKIEDAQMQLGWAQQEFGFGMQQKGIDLSSAQFNQNIAFQEKQVSTERGFAKQSIGLQIETRDLQWGWQQQDYAEESRFMTGRQRKLADRQMGRASIMHDVQGDELSLQITQQKANWKLEDERFAIEKQQFAQNKQLQQEQLNASVKFFEEGKTLQIDARNLQRKYYEDNFLLQERSLQENKTYYEFQYQQQVAMFKAEVQHATVVHTIQEEMLAMTINAKDMKTVVDDLNSKGWPITIDYFKQLQSIMQSYKTGLGAITGKAAGGAVFQGIPEMVGEYGPEMFTPSTSGTIAPNAIHNGSSYFVPANNFSAQSSGQRQTINVYLGNELLKTFVIDTITGAVVNG